MSRKSKVKVGGPQSLKKERTTPPGSETTDKKKTKKPKATDPVVVPPSGESEEQHHHHLDPDIRSTELTLSDPDKVVSDGSVSDGDIPKVQWPISSSPNFCFPSRRKKASVSKCTGVKLTESRKITACAGDSHRLATTDYTIASLPSLVPPDLHPINGRVSTFAKHRDLTNYLRESGCLKLFGSCVLSVYRMWEWPPPEQLLEQMLLAMGYQIPARQELEELTKTKQALQAKIKSLARQRSKLMEKLDEFEGSGASYELLDQDEILPPRPEPSHLNLESLRAFFTDIKFIGMTRKKAGESPDLRVSVRRQKPLLYSLEVPTHDKRLLQ